MQQFIDWFNASSPQGRQPLPALIRSSVTHLYFECIHPFEDGNGRIGRALSAKSLAQSLEQPSLIALSETILAERKKYYEKLEANNKSIKIDDWIECFAQTILKAQNHTIAIADFTVKKTRFFDRHKSKLNERQTKVIERIFRAGLGGFKGGLSTENYISITKTSRATATRDLNELLAEGILVKTGVGRGTRYQLIL